MFKFISIIQKLPNLNKLRLIFTWVEILCGGGDVPVLDTLARRDVDDERLSTSRGGDVPADFFWTGDARIVFSRGGEGPTETLCLEVSGCFTSLYGDALTSVFCRGGEGPTLIECWVSLGGDGPTAISWRGLDGSMLGSRVGVTKRFVCVLELSSRGGEGPQPVETRSFLETVLFFIWPSEKWNIHDSIKQDVYKVDRFDLFFENTNNA